MSMDALTTAAYDSLVKNVLPELLKRLSALKALAPEARAANDELRFLVAEAQELLTLMQAWTGAGAEITSDVTEPQETSAAASDDLSDEDAMALLMAEGAEEVDAAAMAAGSSKKSVADSLSDDNMTADMEAVPAEATAGGDMSDDEARALLAMMDAPVEAAPAPEPEAGGDMSDDEARALLAMMDAPAAAEAASAPDEDVSADDEAMQMLRAMGGMDGLDEDSAKPAAAPVKAASAKAAPVSHHAHGDHGDDHEEDTENLEEVPEFSKNDFSSDPDMLNDFNTNTDELMEVLSTTILQLEQTPEDKETIESIFRAAHTLKGAAGMFGFKAIERVMHRMENLFDLVRKGKLVPNGDIIDVVFQGVDVLRTLLDAVKQGKPSGTSTIPIVRALTKAAAGTYVKGQLSAPGETPAVTKSLAQPAAIAGTAAGASGGGGDDDKAKGPSKKNEQASTIRVDLERLDALVNLVGELVIDRTRFATIEEDIRSSHPQMKMASNLSETVQLFGRHMNEIHEIIMKIRMVPIGNAFNKFTRIVRDLSRQLGKEIELFIDGETTELDKTLVEQIGDPLIHLIRNACDHGIENPETRAAAGKSRSGRVYLSARQEGNHIIITIEDDGKGMNADVIRKKGIERGLIKEDQVLSNRDILNLIFEPGFSTAEKVTEVSGRGVGMDVVRKQISKLKGVIDLNSELGKGSTITIQLPLTLAIVQSLLVESEGECFAIPLSAVIESVRIKPNEIQRVGDAEVIKRHGKVLPLLHLDEILGLSSKSKASWYSDFSDPEGTQRAAAKAARLARRKERLFVVIVGSGERRFGIVVDQLLNQQEMVIKSLGKIMRGTPCVAGGAVLGNGEVVLVIDIQELDEHFRNKHRAPPTAA